MVASGKSKQRIMREFYSCDGNQGRIGEFNENMKKSMIFVICISFEACFCWFGEWVVFVSCELLKSDSGSEFLYENSREK